MAFDWDFYLQAFEELETLLAKHEICIAVKEKLVKDSGVAEEIAYDNIVQKLLTKPRARGKLSYITLIGTQLHSVFFLCLADRAS